MRTIREIFANNLAMIRKERKLSQSGLAELAKCQVQSINKYENQKAWPHPETLTALANALMTTETSLFQDPDNLPAVSESDALSAISAIRIILKSLEH